MPRWVNLCAVPPRPCLLPEALRRGPFRTSDGLAAGLTRWQLQGRALRRMHRGIYVDRALPDTLDLRAAGALLALPPGAVLSHRTAAELRSLPLPPVDQTPEPVHAFVPAPADPRVAGVRAHLCPAPVPAEGLRGLPVTTPGRTWADLAGELGRDDLAILGDAILRNGRTTCADLAAELDRVRRRRGIRLARRVLPLLESRVDSPMETRVRLLILDAGLPRPVVNRPVVDSAGGWIACPDLQYPQFRVAIEYEGEHHRTPAQQRKDIRRDEQYREEGWILIKVTYADVFDRPGTLVERIRRAIARQVASTRE